MGRYLITSALPYINGMKHLGNLVGSMLPADVHARFRRMQGHETLYLCATDEHGTPAEIAAYEAGMDTRMYCDLEHRRQKDVYEGFALSFDYFGRTSSPSCHRLTQAFGERLDAVGLIEERTSRQVYSIDDGRFLPDRYVEGECPFCHALDARGDQCDHCGNLLDPTDLINPRSKLSGSSRIALRETRHLFLLQSKMADIVRRWVDGQAAWPGLTRSIAYKWLDEGLMDRSITRDLVWGVAVTKGGAVRPGFEQKVYYVWFDAPIGYISATVDWAQAIGADWTRWWKTDRGADEVTYVEFMGKDNVAFHTVSFPITLLGAQENWKLVDQLKSFNWLNWYGDRFSTSRRRGLFLDQALDLFPADVWRWYLIANAPESSDTSFRWEHFQTIVNADLANVIGNGVHRIVKFVTNRLEGAIPARGPEGALEKEMRRSFGDVAQELARAHESLEFRKAAAATRALWVLCNSYMQRAAPWALFLNDPAEAAQTTAFALAMVRDAALMSFPIIPNTSEIILNALGVDDRLWPADGGTRLLQQVPPHGPIGTLPILFKRIDEEKLAELEQIYPANGGAEAPL